MNGFSILMFIFAFFVFIAGLYIYTGHRSELLLWKTFDVKKLTLAELKNIGKWTMIASLLIFIIGLLVMILDI